MSARLTAEVLREVADEILRELICCDAYDGKGSAGKHDICYWAGASRAIVLAKAAEMDRVNA